MARQVINRGTSANDGTGDNLRDGAGKVNNNFTELYTAFGDGSTLTAGTFVTTTSTNTLQNKSISLGSNTITGTTAQFNTALTDGSFATLAGSEVLTNKTIDTATNTISNLTNSNLSGSAAITNANLANSTISIGGITFNLGDTDATPAIDLSDATNYPTSSLTGTITNAQLAGSIENAKLSNSTVSIVADDSSAQSISLGGSILFTGGLGITTSISGNEITFATDGSIVTETSSDVLTNKTINGPDNTLTNIANGSLTNSSVTLGATAINLGDTAGSATNFNLSGTSSLSGSGTINTTGSGNRLRFNVAAADATALGSAIDPTTYEGMFAYNTTENYPYVADAAGWTRILTENDSVGTLSDVTISGIADNYMLKWDGTQARFEAVPQKILAAAEIDVTNSGSSAYLFDSHYSGNNPTIYVRAGATYAFNLSVSGHPFHLQTVSGAYSSGNSYTTGLTHIADDGTVTTGASALLKEEGTLYYEIPSGTSGTIYYVCQYHSGMAGSIVIQSDTAAAGVSFTTDKSNTGDGSTTAFTINAGRTVDDVLVIVNGIVLTPTDDYTISSTTLTFTVAPVAAAEIVFRYLG